MALRQWETRQQIECSSGKLLGRSPYMIEGFIAQPTVADKGRVAFKKRRDVEKR
jgi:hypothetical protein